MQVDGVKEAHLRIPLNLLPAAAKTEKGSEASLLGMPTVIAGLALTLAFVSDGFWLSRRGRGTGRTAPAVVLALSLFGLERLGQHLRSRTSYPASLNRRQARLGK